MAVTRINNNQITDSSAGNAYVGINASTKLQAFSVTAGKIANNLVYGSDLTVSGNLTVNGTSTAIDTTITTIEDPVIVLASTQTGSPSVDIGFIGERGTSENIAFVWDESAQEFVTVFTSTSETNTTVTITGYANAHVGNMVVGGTTSLAGNVIGAANFTGNVTGGNLLTAGLVSATGTVTSSANVTGGNILTGGLISSTGTITSATNITGGNLLTGGNVSATGNITGGNIISGNAIIGNINVSGDITVNSLTSNTYVSATGNVVSGNVTTAGLVSATGNVTGGNLLTGGTVSATGDINGGNVSTTGTVTAASTVGGVITGSSTSVTGTQTAASTVGGVITGSSTSVTGTQTAASTVGGVITGSSVSVTGTATAASTVGGVITGSSASLSGNVTAGNISTGGIVQAASTVGGVITGTSVSVTGTATAASTVGGVITGSSASVTGTQTAASTVGGVITGSSTSVTGTQTAASTVGGVITGSSISVTGNVDSGNVLTGGQVSATGNVTGSNVNTNNIVGTGITITSTGTLNLAPTGNITANAKNINNLADPVQEQDAATKIYVDTVAQGLDIKASVVYTTTANIAPYTYNNGASGVGATLTAQAVGNLTIDGNVVSAGERVLIKNEVGAYVDTTTQSAAFNGIYVVTTAGSPSVAYVLTRALDFDNGSPSGEIPGAFTFVEKGATQADTGWVCTTNAPVTVGTTQIIFTQFSGAGSYTAGAGLSLTGTQFNVLTDGNANPTTGINGSNQVVVPAGAAFTTPNIGAATGTSLSATGTITAASTVGGVITGSSSSVTGTVTAASTVGGVITGSSTSVTGTVTAASTVGGVITGTSTSVTGTQTAASTVGGVITGSSTSVTGTVTAASTVGGVITGTSASLSGNVDGGNVLTGGILSSTGNITGGNILSGGLGSFTGNVTAANFFGNISGNIDAAGANTQVQFNDTGDILGASAGFTFNKTTNLLTVTGNVASGNVTTGGQVSATANVTGGNVLTSGLISATANVTGGNVLTGGQVSATANVTGGNILTGGQVISTGTGSPTTGAGQIYLNGATNNRIDYNTNGTGAPAFTTRSDGTKVVLYPALSGSTADYALGIDAATLWASVPEATAGFNFKWYGATTEVGSLSGTGNLSVSGNVTGANILTGGLISATSNVNGGNLVSGANLTITGGNIFSTASAITVNGDSGDVNFAVNGDTTTVFFVDAGTGTASFGNATQTTNALVAFNTSSSILFPVGNTGQRPSTGVTGMVRFNSTTNNMELYDNSEWTAVGVPSFTVIADEQFNGDGITVAFTLDTTQTTNSCIVSINGVVQIPIIAYSVAGTDPSCVLTFTEAPSEGDIIDVRQITTTTTVTAISNSSGNAVIGVDDTSATVTITGDLEITGNATVLGNLATDAIINGTSQIQIPDPNQDIHFDVNGQNAVILVGQFDSRFAGNINPAGNVTYDLGNTTNRWKDLWLSNSTIYMGNAQISANATSLIFTNPQGGQTVLAGATSAITGATVSVTGTVTAASVVGGVITGSSTSVTGTVTAASTVGGVITGSSTSVTGTQTAASTVGGVITGSSASVTGTVTAASTVGGVITGSSVSLTGAVTSASLSASGNVTGGNILVGGLISTAGNISCVDISARNVDLTQFNLTCGNIINGNPNGIGNIGSATTGFNVVHAKATSAQYADLAEMYVADAEYAPGTVVVFGGTHEVTVNAADADRKVAGVVSTNPSYIMNAGCEGEHVAAVALTGRVPTMVVGTVRKGDMMVSAGLGRARAEANPKVGTVIGKALEDFDGSEGTIEVVVGRF